MNIVKFEVPGALGREVEECLETSRKKMKERGFTKCIICMADPSVGVIAYEAANVTDAEYIYMLEVIKSLMIKEKYNI